MTLFAPLGHARGPADAPVTVEMYGNYECLHCRRAWPAVEALLEEVGDGVRFVFHHFARPADFPHAELAAEAAEAAAAEGKFWAMHALLMTEAPSLHPEVLLASAAALGLERGVTRTPTFHVDGVPVPPAADLSALRERLDEALAAAR